MGALVSQRMPHAGLSRSQDTLLRLRKSQIYEISDASEGIKTILSVAASTAVLAALIRSSLPVVTESKSQREEPKSDDDEAEGIKWGLMSVVSCLPLFNWLAWVFAAFENEERANFYYTLAAIYALPQLTAGFQQDFFSIATLLAGIAHVQVERIADERGLAQNTLGQDSKQDVLQQLSKAVTNATQRTAGGEKPRQSRAAPDADEPQKEEEGESSREELRKWDEAFEAKKVDKEKR